MLTILVTILPVFLVIGAGYVGVRSGYVDSAIGDALNQFAVRFAVPLLLFRALVNLDFSQAFNVWMLISFYAGAIASFALGILLANKFLAMRPGESVAIGFGCMFSNSVLLGIPIAERVFGQSILPFVFGIIAIHAAFLYVMGIITMELTRRDGIALSQALVKAARSIATNSLMIGVFLGAMVNISGLSLPQPITSAVNMIAGSALPIALVGIGATLARFKINQEIKPVFLITAVSLVVHPAIAFCLAHFVFALDPLHLQAAVIIAAMPPGTNIYFFAVMYNRATNIAASAILVGTIVSILTITAWVAVVHSIAG